MSEVELNEPSVGGYSVSLPTFEGPLDLLLHLCQKHELDILDIPIAFITEKYLEYLAVMQLMNLDVASEYLVMAATLAHIKSKMLLPAPPPGQEDEVAAEEEDPREALIRRLLEYQKYKQAAEELQARGVAGRDVFMRGSPIEEAVHTGLPPLAQVPLFSLVEAFQNVLAKSKVKLSHDVVHERITLTDRINELVDILRVRRRIAFEDLFEHMQTRFDLVITFLALLEMTRLRMTRLYQENFESAIYVEFTAQVGSEDDDGASAEQAPSPGDATQAAAPDDASSATDPPAAPAADTTPPEDEAAFATDPPEAIASDPSEHPLADETSSAAALASDASLPTDPPEAIASDPSDTALASDPSEDALASDPSDTALADDASLPTDPPEAIASDPSDTALADDASLPTDPPEAIASDPSDTALASDPSEHPLADDASSDTALASDASENALGEASLPTDPPEALAFDASEDALAAEASLPTDPPEALAPDPSEDALAAEASLPTDPPAAMATETTPPFGEAATVGDVFEGEPADALERTHAEPRMTSPESPQHTIPCPPPDEGAEGSDARADVATASDGVGPGSSADDAPASHVATISRADDADAEGERSSEAGASLLDAEGTSDGPPEASAPEPEQEADIAGEASASADVAETTPGDDPAGYVHGSAAADGASTGEDRPEATGQASTDDASSRDNASSPDASAAGTAAGGSSLPAAPSDSPSSSSDPS